MYYYDYLVIRSKGQQVEYAIYRYNSDGSLDDLQDVVILNKEDDIKQYIKERYGQQ